MKKYSVGIRLVSLLLSVMMLVTMVPVIGASAASLDAEGFLGSVRLRNNGESITLPIKLNNFALDGLLFEYLSSVTNTRNSQYYLYETGGAYQLFTLHLAGKKVGIDNNGNLADKDGVIQPDSDAMSGQVDLDHSLTSPQGTTTQNYKGVTSGGAEHSATVAPYVMTDGSGAKYLQLRQYNRTSQNSTGRSWRKLTRFTASRKISQSRYAVLIYRVNGDTTYDNMLLTWDYCDELSDRSNCSQTVDVAKGTGVKWQYAIIDLAYELGETEEQRAAAAARTNISDIYLQTPLDYDLDKSDTGKSMDLAAVAYFPYYGDAEQFAHYGLTLGCAQKYYNRDNRGLDFINGTRTSGNNYSVSSLSQWDDAKTGDQIHSIGVTSEQKLQIDGTTGNGIINTVDELSYALFGEMKGYASLGLLESQLDENGRPVYKEVVVDFVAMYLQNRLTGVEEYPSDNYGWKNVSFVTGVSTTSEKDEHLFGKDDLGHSIDLGTALCNRVAGAKRGSGTASGTMGTYWQTRGKAKELIGTWEQCEGNIDTWYDAAYYLLHNLYVTDEDTAYNGDSYGEYENDLQSLIMGQVDYKNADGKIVSAYAFDSGFCLNGSNTETAVIYDRTNHTMSIDPAADLTGGRDPFLPSSGTGTETGESNSPYYVDDYVVQHGRGYRKRDYHFTISGNGSFQYEPDLFFEFVGDDDVYLFINGQLVLDIGGTHSATSSKIHLDDYVDWAWSVKNGTQPYKGKSYHDLDDTDRARVDALALQEGGVYSLDFFYMERHGAGSNLRIVTNIEVTAGGLNVDKTAYQNDVEIAENGIINADKPIEYGFKITNDTVNKLNRITFHDSIIGVSIDHINGLVISDACIPYVRNAYGNPLTAADLKIYVTGEDEGSDVTVTCRNNEELKSFLTNLTSDDGTQSGDGLWVKASIQIRGIYYTMTDAQKKVGSFRNYVSATAAAESFIYRGADEHTVYQPGRPAYYQWVGHPVVIERAQLYRDLLNGVVENAAALPALGNMILVPSNADGVERQDNGISNTRGGDVYLEINYTVPRTYVAYVTIRDETDPSYRMTVPITIYATDSRDSAMVLDYGLDSYLTDNEAVFDYELDLAVGGNVTGTVMGIADQGITPTYQPYNTTTIDTAIGNTKNPLNLVNGTYADTLFTNARFKLDTPIYLEHTKPWVIEFAVSNLRYSSCLFSLEETRETDGNLQLYLHKSGSMGHITLGAYSAADKRTNNYGVQTSRMITKPSYIKLYNVLAGDGTNMVYCSVDGNPGVAMNNVYYNGTSQNRQDSTWINGRDFTFRYMGCKGSPDSYNLQLNMEYLRVYEEGEQLVHYRWEKKGNEYVCTDTKEPGYKEQKLEHDTFENNEKTVHRWRNLNVNLNSDRAWEVEFEMQIPDLHPSLMLFSSTGSKETNHTEYLYIIPGKRFVSLGSDVDGSYMNYGAVLPADFDLTQTHTYLLKNYVQADGSNMVYLYVDRDEHGRWTEVGPLNYYSLGSSIGTQSNGLSGHDFNFKYVGGHDGFGFISQVVSYIEVHEDTALRTAYEWRADPGTFTSVYATGGGNCIAFPEEESGIIHDDSGKFTLENGKLKFETSDFMDQAYTAYVALTIHDKKHVPTPLNQTGINVAKEVQMYKKLSVIPANVVYYEDDFPAIHYMEGNTNVFTPIGTGTLDKLQSPDQDTEYGSDEAYQTDLFDRSGDHVTQIAIQEDSALAWFGFTGTGFELISSTNASNSPIMYLDVYRMEDVTVEGNSLTVNAGAEALDWIPLSTEFDHGNNDGKEVIYQVPLIRWQRQDVAETAVDESRRPDEYVVVISAYESYDYSQPGNPKEVVTYLYIDGIRIYQPMGYENQHYNETENRVLFEEVRNHIIDGNIMACEKNDAGVTISSGTVTWTERFNGRDYTGTYYEGNKVTSVNDYLLKGPNNEVYLNSEQSESSLAFVVYRNGAEAYSKRMSALQIGVRAIDAGNFYGTDASGMKAELELGVTDGNGTHSWMHLATVTGGTEQYVSIPYELCPAVMEGDTLEYHVVLRVVPCADGTPAMVSFSGLKRTEGLELKKGIGEPVTIYQDKNGQWVTSAGNSRNVTNFLMVKNAVATKKVISFNEAVRGENFEYDVVTPEYVPTIVPQYPTLSFESEVRYNIYFTTQNLENVAPENMGLITFDTENPEGTVADAAEVIPGAVFNGSSYMVHTNGIPAKKLGDDLYFKVYAKLADGSYVYSRILHYSAETYARQQLAGEHETVKPLVVAMLNYGAEAQKFFGYNTDDLMNAELTAEQQALVQPYHSDMAAPVRPVDSSKVGMFIKNDAFTALYPTVSFESAFAINYYAAPAHKVDGDITLYFWDTATYDSVAELTAENASVSQKMTLGAEGDLYAGAYTAIAAKELGETVYAAAVYESDGIMYCSGVIAYSLSRYCKSFAENPASDLQGLAAATTVYGCYAEQYFAK